MRLRPQGPYIPLPIRTIPSLLTSSGFALYERFACMRFGGRQPALIPLLNSGPTCGCSCGHSSFLLDGLLEDSKQINFTFPESKFLGDPRLLLFPSTCDVGSFWTQISCVSCTCYLISSCPQYILFNFWTFGPTRKFTLSVIWTRSWNKFFEIWDSAWDASIHPLSMILN